MGPLLPGLIPHLASEPPGGGLDYVDVWETEGHCDRFVDERLHPALGALLAEVFGDTMPPEPAGTPRRPHLAPLTSRTALDHIAARDELPAKRNLDGPDR